MRYKRPGLALHARLDLADEVAPEAMGIGQRYLSSLEGGKFGSSLTHALRLLRLVAARSSSARGSPVAGQASAIVTTLMVPPRACQVTSGLGLRSYPSVPVRCMASLRS